LNSSVEESRRLALEGMAPLPPSPFRAGRREPRVVLVNGINTDGEGSIDLLGVALRRLAVEVVDVLLPRRSVVSARWGANRDARAVAQVSSPGDVVVGHSYGCLRAARAAAAVPYRAIVCVAPAMPRGFSWPSPGLVTCYYSRTDVALKAARLLLLHPFGGGSAGLEGFAQVGVHNVPCHGTAHSEYFEGALLRMLVSRVVFLLGD